MCWLNGHREDYGAMAANPMECANVGQKPGLSPAFQLGCHGACCITVPPSPLFSFVVCDHMIKFHHMTQEAIQDLWQVPSSIYSRHLVSEGGQFEM